MQKCSYGVRPSFNNILILVLFFRFTNCLSILNLPEPQLLESQRHCSYLQRGILVEASLVVNKIFSILASGEHQNYIGEPISQLDHALQCAQLAIEENCSQELIIAALLHDIGHLCADKDAQQMDGYGIVKHENIGAQFILDCGFGQNIADLIANHVNAKRYLARDMHYLEKLSDASKKTLIKQGGIMNDQEAAEFEKSPFFYDILKLRELDDKAKEFRRKVLPLSSYKDILINHLNRQNKVHISENL